VGNAFALSKRSGISTVFAASILSVPARHAAMGNWLFIACLNDVGKGGA
jgi:hypothetical protein